MVQVGKLVPLVVNQVLEGRRELGHNPKLLVTLVLPASSVTQHSRHKIPMKAEQRAVYKQGALLPKQKAQDLAEVQRLYGPAVQVAVKASAQVI